MGEHVKWRGQHVKLGTCENLYYVTFEQCLAICSAAQKLEGNCEPHAYVDPKHKWRYRFPFPDEDGTPPGAYKDFDRGLLIGVPHDSILIGQEHGDIAVPVSVKGGGTYNVNIFVPCPFKLPSLGAAAPRNSGRPTTVPIEIVQQRLMEDGALWTVCRCGWCGDRWRLPPEEGVALSHVLESLDTGTSKYFKLVAQRVLAGYARAAKPTR